LAIDPAAGARLRAFMEPRIGKVQPWCERNGIGRDTIYALWRGREPQPDTMARIADALGVSYERLLRERAGLPETETEGGALVAALLAQTAALSALVAALNALAGEIGSASEAQAGMNEGLAAVAAQVVAALEVRSGTR
jgi:transcriptional regulator with XRE-family HTH domain